MTSDEEAEIWRRRKERALRWRREDGTIAPGYPTVSLEEETEETLSAEPPIEPASHRKKKQKEEAEGQA